jgi:CrcB protein
VLWLLVGLAGAAGALTRYGLALLVGPRGFPWTTLAINVTGSFVLGVVLTAAMAGRVSPQVAVVVGTGFLGAYTTYSTFSWELVLLLRDGQWPRAGAYLLLSIVLGVGAAALGYRLGVTLRP